MRSLLTVTAIALNFGMASADMVRPGTTNQKLHSLRCFVVLFFFWSKKKASDADVSLKAFQL